MIVLDANYILRYLVNDHPEMYAKAKAVIEGEACLVLGEVIAEVVYVLDGYYEVPRAGIAEAMIRLLGQETLSTHEPRETLIAALELFARTKLDYVGCVLCALKSRYEVRSFDKGVKRC